MAKLNELHSHRMVGGKQVSRFRALVPNRVPRINANGVVSGTKDGDGEVEMEFELEIDYQRLMAWLAARAARNAGGVSEIGDNKVVCRRVDK